MNATMTNVPQLSDMPLLSGLRASPHRAASAPASRARLARPTPLRLCANVYNKLYYEPNHPDHLFAWDERKLPPPMIRVLPAPTPNTLTSVNRSFHCPCLTQ